jgi:uncharacterized protein
MKKISEEIFEHFLKKSTLSSYDAGHDIEHIRRVVKNCRFIMLQEAVGEENVIIPAAYLHDCVTVQKNSEKRSQGSLLSAKKAVEFLQNIQYPPSLISDIAHCIEAHSYSSGKKAETLNAQIVQDADRLDSLGAIGITRCVSVGLDLQKVLYCQDDPFCKKREPDDSKYILDHFYTKLSKLISMFNTKSAKDLAEKRWNYMKNFLSQFEEELKIQETIV